MSAADEKRADLLICAIDPVLFGERIGLPTALARIEVLAVHQSTAVREAWADVREAWDVVRDAIPGNAARAAWRTVRGELRRARRLSSKTLPALSDAAQNLILARDALDRMIPKLPPDCYAEALTVRDHLVATIDALRTSPSEPPPPREE